MIINTVWLFDRGFCVPPPTHRELVGGNMKYATVNMSSKFILNNQAIGLRLPLVTGMKRLIIHGTRILDTRSNQIRKPFDWS